ncbi:hypothetical protein [Salinispora tropica]|uniref:hypothetical protein n=1 Tax=Salinispora tropica TaxID=168695 RepID=UPI00068540A4|nr:hypothetical protein [Salinispora tropica]
MNQQSHTHDSNRPGASRAGSRRRWWAAGLAGMTGLALTATFGVASPAAGTTGRILTTTDDPTRDRPFTNDHRNDSKSDKRKDKKDTKPSGTPVPCDADALIAAITLANARDGAVLDLARDCTYLLTADIDGNGLPVITAPITLNGNKNTTIERAANADEFRILTVDTGGNLTLDHLTITGGQTTSAGGGILVNPGGTLTTNRSTVTRNIADSNGGGIVNNGTTRIISSTISHNTADGPGGGIYSLGVIDVKKSHVNANTTTTAGAGVMSFGTARIEHSTVTANHAQGTIGGLFISGTGTVTDSKFSKNTALEAAGVVMNFDTQLTLKAVTIIENIATQGRAGGLATSDNSSVVVEGGAITNNAATTDGGGIYNFADLVLRDTKITGNQADQGAGIYNEETVILFDTKVVKNVAITDGGGIVNDGGTVELNTATGTIVIKN